MVIEVIGLIISAASLGFDLNDHLKNQDLHRKIDKAYNAALKKWCRNNYIRNRIAKHFLNYSDLVTHIKTSDKTVFNDDEYASFLKVWEAILKDDEHTYNLLLEMLMRHGIELSEEIRSGQVETLEEVRELTGEIRSGKETLFERLNAIIEKIDKLPQKSVHQFTTQTYSRLNDYIKRNVHEYIKTDSLGFLFSPQSPELKYLIDYLIQENPEKRIVLYSEAQAGKSTELANLAYEAQSSDLFNVILYNLKNYIGDPLTNAVDLDLLMTDNTKRNLLILDGLDEVKDDRRRDVILQIENIASKYPALYIVVSCRGNYEKTNEVEGFKKLYVDPLSWADVQDYIKRKCPEPDTLLTAIRQKQLYDLIYNPFYLKSIIDHYREKGNLPKTKSEIYDFVIDKSFDVDQKKIKGKRSR